MARTRCYRKGRLEAEGFPVAEVSDYLAQPDTTVWFDLCQPTAEDLASISEELGLHPLAVEDAASEHQRPKLDHYPTHLFLTAYDLRLDADGVTLDHAELAAFITEKALVTVRKTENFDIDDVVARWDANPELAHTGVSYLLHGLLDHVVDTHFTAMQGLDDAIDALEDEVFNDTVKDVTMQKRTFALRKSLVTARRVVLPMREVVNTLLRRDLHVIEPELAPYFQDIYDHVLRVSESTESMRELISNIYETHLTVRSNRLNVVMKQVTSWAAIIAVPTAVTGFYGQNVPYPGFQEMSGFWVSTLVTVALAVGLYVLFRRKGWL